MKDINQIMKRYIDMIIEDGNEDLVEEIIITLQSYLNKIHSQ